MVFGWGQYVILQACLHLCCTLWTYLWLRTMTGINPSTARSQGQDWTLPPYTTPTVYAEFFTLQAVKLHDIIHVLDTMIPPLTDHLSWTTTYSWESLMSHISMQMNLLPKTTCLKRPYFNGRLGGPSRQGLLYNADAWVTVRYIQ